MSCLKFDRQALGIPTETASQASVRRCAAEYTPFGTVFTSFSLQRTCTKMLLIICAPLPGSFGRYYYEMN